MYKISKEDTVDVVTCCIKCRTKADVIWSGYCSEKSSFNAWMLWIYFRFWCSVWEFYQLCRGCKTEYWCMLMYVSCLYWRVIGYLDKDDRVDWNKSVMCTRPVFSQVWAENTWQFEETYLKIQFLPPQRKLAVFTAKISHIMIYLFWEPHGAREPCVGRMRSFFEAETGDTCNYQRWSGRPIPGRDQTFIFFPKKRPDRSWGLTILHSVGTASYVDSDKAARAWSWPLTSI